MESEGKKFMLTFVIVCVDPPVPNANFHLLYVLHQASHHRYHPAVGCQ